MPLSLTFQPRPFPARGPPSSEKLPEQRMVQKERRTHAFQKRSSCVPESFHSLSQWKEVEMQINPQFISALGMNYVTLVVG